MNTILIRDHKIQIGSRLATADEARNYALSILMAVDALSANVTLLKFAGQPPRHLDRKTHVQMRERSVIGLISENGWQPLMVINDGRPSAEMTQYAEALARDVRQNVLLQNESILTTETLVPHHAKP